MWYCTHVYWLCSRFVENCSRWSWSTNPSPWWFCYKLVHLNLNAITALCECWLGIEPSLDLFKYFYTRTAYVSKELVHTMGFTLWHSTKLKSSAWVLGTSGSSLTWGSHPKDHQPALDSTTGWGDQRRTGSDPMTFHLVRPRYQDVWAWAHGHSLCRRFHPPLHSSSGVEGIVGICIPVVQWSTPGSVEA
jgi:hypothetical protein